MFEHTGMIVGATALGASVVLTAAYLRCRQNNARLNSEQKRGRLWTANGDATGDPGKTIEHLAEGVYRTSLDGKQIYANRALLRLNGYKTHDEMIAAVKDLGSEWYVEPNRRSVFVETLDKYGFVENFVSEIYRHKTRERIWISENARLVRDPKTGEPAYYEGSVREVTDRIFRRRQAEIFAKLSDNLPGGMFQMELRHDRRAYVPYVSSGFCRFVDMPIVNSIDDARPYFERIHPDDRRRYNQTMTASAKELTEWRVEFRLADRKGIMRHATLLATPEKFDEGVRWYGYMFDTTAQKLQENEINQLAYYDSLTGLMNRQFMTNTLEKAMKLNTRLDRYGAVLFIDLDNFKTLNDNFGHDYGDKLLQEIARRLQCVVPKDDYVARFGGDEFVVLLSVAGDKLEDAHARVTQLAQAICDSFAAPVDLAGHMHSSTCSVGASFFGGQEATLADVLASADTAMYEAKRKGKNTFEIFDDKMQKDRSRRYTLLQDLKHALDKDQFSLMLQPQVDRSGKIVGAEALARWTHPEFGIVSPGEFIPILERSGHILDFTFWSLHEAITILQRWHRDPDRSHLKLSLNLSPHCISQEVLWQRIEQIVAASGAVANKLTLEMTESAAASNMEITRQRMSDIKQYGVEFAIDDFGTGYSAFANLKHFEFDELKIDNAFVGHIADDVTDQRIVKAVIDTAAALNMRVVAEFVETDAQETKLRALGCDLFQGYRYSPAVPEDKFGALVDVMRKTHQATPAETWDVAS